MGSEKKIGFLVRPPPFYGGNPYEELIQMTDGSQKPFCSFARAKKKRRKGKGDRERSQKNEQAVAHAVARTSKQQAPSKPTNNQHELHGYVHPQGRRRQANPVQEGRLQGHPQTSHDGRHAGKKTRRPSRRLERARDPGRAPAGLSRASVVARDTLPPPPPTTRPRGLDRAAPRPDLVVENLRTTDDPKQAPGTTTLTPRILSLSLFVIIATHQVLKPEKKYECLSYLPPLSDADISKQVDYLVQNGWSPCIEFASQEEADTNQLFFAGPALYENRYWTMWKLPMFGCQSGDEVLKEIDECQKEYPGYRVRVVGFDRIRQVQMAGFIVRI